MVSAYKEGFATYNPYWCHGLPLFSPAARNLGRKRLSYSQAEF